MKPLTDAGLEAPLKAAFSRYIQSVPKGGFSFRRKGASCVLRHSKLRECPKTTCPCRGLENTLQSRGFVQLKMDLYERDTY